MKLDRMMGILVSLMQCERTSAPALAEKFEVSRRTIRRDVDALCRAGLPIETRQGAGGGISLAEGYRLDVRALTEDERENLVAALKGLGTVSDPAPIGLTLEKLAASGAPPERLSIDLASFYRGDLSKRMTAIRRAMRESRVIEFTYCSEKGITRRAVEPYRLAFRWEGWYLFGYCLEKQDYRLFKLTRLWDLEVRDEAFTPRVIPPGKLDFDARFADGTRLVVLFDPSVRHRLIESYGPECYRDEGHFLRLETGYTGEAYILSWLLSFGSQVRVLEPAGLAERIKEHARATLAQYESPDQS